MSDSNPQIEATKELFNSNILLLDVRSPVEYAEGSFINSINLPLMDNEERHLVGLCYKEKGHDEALKLGHELVSGSIKEERLHQWIQASKNTKDMTVYIMCFRGGLRSRIVQQWIFDSTGVRIPLVAGGYKALRQVALKIFRNPFEDKSAYLIGGHTGSGKTKLLNEIHSSIDLEDIAKHRGSAFGALLEPQPTQATFENHLAKALVDQCHTRYKSVFLEHESRSIGRIMLPLEFMDQLSKLQLIVLQTSLEERTHNTWLEYVHEAQRQYCTVYGEAVGLIKWQDDLKMRFKRIQKRLGLERYGHIIKLFEHAQQNNLVDHKHWIEYILKYYYDPMYDYQRKHWSQGVVFEGTKNDIQDYIHTLS